MAPPHGLLACRRLQAVGAWAPKGPAGHFPRGIPLPPQTRAPMSTSYMYGGHNHYPTSGHSRGGMGGYNHRSRGSRGFGAQGWANFGPKVDFESATATEDM